ncbi:VirB4 family type IV secretion/conjugal transfer ATPase [Sphingomonas crocodyli]|uniref:VirB4 family type IV secretion/conjugal transfer ATPase n=2 Tax=Sphingomonas crocodyli TaxID=1979270 RepID=A0A437LYQ7_9SPHN|nr:VirB4 family type IV secretion/conjugal transfer ATPase [Sphingomonas crocodyli]RVT90550.1 VirB4 family type IV secretion/conjugal transfer ATPase [Sphingomonas crocodyli]
MALRSEKAARAVLRREQDPTRFLPFARHVDRHIIALDDRSLMISFQLDGVAFETSDPQDLNAWHEKLNALWRNLADERLAVWTHHIRRVDDQYPGGQFRSDFARALDAAYRDRIGARPLFLNELFVTLVMRPAAGGADQVADLMRRLSRAAATSAETDPDAVRRIEEKARDFEKLLAACRPRRLGVYERHGLAFSEPLEMLEQVMTGRRLPVPLVAGHLGSALYSSRAIFGAEVIEIRSADRSSFAGMFGIREYPAATRPAQLAGLLRLACPLIVSQSFTFLGKAAAAERFRRRQNQMYSTEDVAESQADQLSYAADDLASNRFVLGDHHFSLALFAPTLRALNDHMSHARAALADAGMVAAREGPALEAAYWSQLPGNFAWRSRPAAITSRNFAALSPFHTYPAGRARGNHWGQAVALLKTSAGSPYYFNFHKDDVGHTLIVGPSGSGKTVIQNFLMAQLEKLASRQIFIDKDRGAEIFVRASGGTYLALANGAPTGFAPLKALAATPADRAFARRFVRMLVAASEGMLTPAEDRMIDEGLAALSRLPAPARTLTALRAVLGQSDAAGIGARLERWCAGGALGWVFDNDEDTLGFDARFVGFDMTDFLDNAEIRGPLMAYMFHRIDALLGEEAQADRAARTVIDVDEFWKALGDEAFRAFAQDGLRTFRKRNAFLVLGTQSPAEAISSPIASAIIEQVATQILLPNPRGRAEDYIDGLGLTAAEFRLIREELQPESRRFLVKQGHDAIVVELDLGGMDDALALLSGRSETLPILEAARAAAGDDPTAWLPEFQRLRRARGLHRGDVG